MRKRNGKSCGKVPVRQISELELPQPPSPGSFFWVFVDLFAGGGSTAAAVTLGTVADESRKKMADGGARSPSRLCSRDGKICCYGDALRTNFLPAFVACFLLFVLRFAFFFYFLIFFVCIPVCLSSSCPFVCAAATCYSQQVRIL